MFKKLTDYFKAYRRSLFVIDQRELSGGAKFLLGIFVLTVFIVIGWGLSWQTGQTKSPYQQFGHECKNLINKKEALTFKEIEVKYRFHRSEQEYQNLLKGFGDDGQCKELGSYYVTFLKDPPFKTSASKLKVLRQQRSRVSQQIKRLKSSYGDMLLEKAVGQNQDKSILPSSASKAAIDLKAAEEKLATLDSEIKEREDLKSYESYQKFGSYYQANRENIREHYRSALRYYHFKRTMQAFAFLIPIWLLFYILYRVMVSRQHFILSHLTVHVANVAALYALFYLILFIYDIMPKLFFQKIITFFMQYNMAIVLNILAIFFFIILFGLIIYRVQKNDTTGSKKRKQELINLKMGKCSECGSNITDDYCPVCGFQHYTDCPSCHQKTLAKGVYCCHCGKKLKVIKD
ncbi:MAG: zinc ribbon domain-containing protein [Campylobacterota bacterium]|nr:zinc ribbon domain-containing protein [Campylobacterota bacterium]